MASEELPRHEAIYGLVMHDRGTRWHLLDTLVDRNAQFSNLLSYHPPQPDLKRRRYYPKTRNSSSVIHMTPVAINTVSHTLVYDLLRYPNIPVERKQ